ncbi:putative sporulation-specific protein [Suhomyces tanzawaensis NRRL Y-17324]|uniref:Putative sporulation-specific protein n=1 Tax=Suhomyces tanzawaensis NRRL Y-17324 TaxID=984487 RepID=A0A1E4SH68_9ASCO|nr:putative sporulation-specific protein [Suhomyces tanzawaensis NRRL Y-17324]ODV78859.1 putative sporulation-specific protein [Suhomyces tanzawaensis NRRL Y-17324]
MSTLALFSLKGKVAVLTGGTNGIGLGYVRGLAGAEISQIILTYRNEDALKTTIKEIERINRNVKVDAIKVDFAGDEDQNVQLITEESYRLSITGKVDILINNAGIAHRSPLEDFPQEKFDEVIKVNLNIPIKLTKSIGTRMIESETEGKIVFTASLLSFQGGLNATPYAVSKGGIKSFTQAVSNEWASKGVRVNSIAPGYIETKMTDTMDPKNRSKIIDRIPFGRWGNIDDFQGPIVFLVSDASRYVTGETLVVDGGWMSR